MLASLNSVGWEAGKGGGGTTSSTARYLFFKNTFHTGRNCVGEAT